MIVAIFKSAGISEDKYEIIPVEDTETFEECEVGMDVYQLFPEYTGYNRTFP